MVYGYCRVSTPGQKDNYSFEEQRNAILERYPQAEIYEETYSGAKVRPIFTELMDKLQKGDILAVSKLDRFCRSTKEGLEYIQQLKDKGVTVDIFNIGVISDTPVGKMFLTVMLAVAELERETIISRMAAGKELAKKNNPNYREGRPRKYSDEQLKMAVELLYQGFSYKTVMRLTGIGRTTLVTAKQKRRDQEKLAEINQE